MPSRIDEAFIPGITWKGDALLGLVACIGERKLVEGAPGEASAVVIDGRSIDVWAIQQPEGQAQASEMPSATEPVGGS